MGGIYVEEVPSSAEFLGRCNQAAAELRGESGRAAPDESSNLVAERREIGEH